MLSLFPKDDAAQLLRVKRFFMAFGAYCIWCLIALFTYLLNVAPVSLKILLGCFAGIFLSNALVYAAIRSGFNKRFKDPSLTLPQMIIATCWAMMVMYYADEARSGVLLLYLVVFVFGLFKLNLRQFLYLSLYAVCNYALVLFLLYRNRPQSISVKIDLLNLIILALVLPWFSFMGAYITRLKNKVSEALSLAKDAELKFRTIFDSASDGIVVADATTGRFIAANETICQMLGYSQEELLQLNISDISPKQFFEALSHEYAKSDRQKSSIVRNVPLIRKDKSIFYTDINSSWITMEGRKYLAGVIRDITERLQAEEFLKASEKRYRLLADNVSDLIFTLDMNFNFTYASPSSHRLLGYSAEELTLVKIEEMVEPETFEFFGQILEKELEKEKRSENDLHRSRIMEFPLKHRNGSMLWLETTVSFLRNEDNQPIGIIGTAHNITDRKMAQEQLRQSEEKYRTILENMEEGYFEVDLAGHYTFFNDTMCKIHGCSRKELMGMNNLHYMDKDVAQKVYHAFNKVYKTGKTNKGFGWQIIRKDGERREVESSISVMKDGSDHPLGFRGIVRDVTERKQMEEKLHFEEQRFRSVVEYASDIIVLVNPEGMIVYANPAMEYVLGYKPEETIGKSGFSIVHPDDVPLLANALNSLVKNPESSSLHGEIHLRHKNGAYRTLEAVGSNLVRSNMVEAVIINFRDITERKLAEEALRQSEQMYLELSIIDDLTQIFNSRHFHAQLEKEMERANRYNQPLTLLMLDLDKFKNFNDTYGHLEGDNVLFRLGQVIKRCLRDPDSAYRYGGEEFTILLPMTTKDKGVMTAQRIQSEFRKETFTPVPEKEVFVTMSIGVAQYRPKEDMKSFVYRADQLMYQAKKNGRDRICFD